MKYDIMGKGENRVVAADLKLMLAGWSPCKASFPTIAVTYLFFRRLIKHGI